MARVPTTSKRLRLAAGALPLLGLVGDLLATLQGEAIWRHGAAVACGLGALALLWELPLRRRPRPALVASVLLGASLGARVLAPLPADAQLALGTWLAAAAVGLLLVSGALLEGLASPDGWLEKVLDTEPAQDSSPVGPHISRAA